MATLEDITDVVANDILTRSDDQYGFVLKCALRSYRTLCNAVPFPELRVRSDEITLTSGTATVNLATEIPDYTVAGIISIRYTNGTRKFRLTKLGSGDAALHDQLQYSVSGVPSTYARVDHQTIEFNLAPSASTDTMRVYFWQKPVVNTDSVEDTAQHTLLLPEEWEELLEYYTLWRCYHMLQEFDKAHALMYPSMTQPGPSTQKRHVKELGIIPHLRNDLLKTITDRESVDDSWGLQPYRREY